MVGRSEGSLGGQLSACEPAGDAVDARHFDRLGMLERGQDRGQPLREHRLTGSGWPAEQAVVGARRGDRERFHRARLTAHVAEVEAVAGVGNRYSAGRGERVGGVSAQDPRCAGEALGHTDGESLHQRCLAGARRADDEHAHSSLHRRLGDRKRAVRGPHLPVERELSEERVRVEPVVRYLSTRCQHSAGERQVESGSDLRHVGGSEVGRYATGGKLISGVEDGSVDAVARLAHGCVGQADDRKRRQARPDVHLHAHCACMEPFDRKRARPSEHECLPSRWARQGRRGLRRLSSRATRAHAHAHAHEVLRGGASRTCLSPDVLRGGALAEGA
jgi:hypothetical protein